MTVYLPARSWYTSVPWTNVNVSTLDPPFDHFSIQGLQNWESVPNQNFSIQDSDLRNASHPLMQVIQLLTLS